MGARVPQKGPTKTTDRTGSAKKKIGMEISGPFLLIWTRFEPITVDVMMRTFLTKTKQK